MPAYGSSDSGLESSTYPLKYMMRATFLGREDYHTEDFFTFCSIRSPINKTSSFATMTITLNPMIYTALQDSIARNTYPDVKIECWIVKNQDKSGSEYPPKVEDAFEKAYMCISLQLLESATAQTPFLNATLILINPILLYLQGTNGFNQICENVTSLDVLKKYESWLQTMFTGNAFQFEKVGENYGLNSWSYEQILTRNSTDLIIPSVLINQYKMWDTFGYYFFDDFRFDKGATADITGYLINLGDKNQFPTFNIYDYPDLAFGLRPVDIKPLHDPFNALYQKNTSIITKSNEMQFGFRKATGKRSLPVVQVSRQDGTRASKSGSSIIKTTITSTKEVEPTEETMIYAPDDHSAALNRFDKISKQLKDDILTCEKYYLKDSSFDYIQFGKRYNLDANNVDVYDYVPITICNFFIKEQGNIPVLIHNSQIQFFRYRPDEYIPRPEQPQYVSGG